jgi:hypothetical protein
MTAIAKIGNHSVVCVFRSIKLEKSLREKEVLARQQWLTPAILTTREAEIRRIEV